ncbi:MAG: hypothetical protein KF777_04880 [Planctomycetaceae bacterium]|nr:hypothetical protein [Planctomycetaceae bacterium]
MSDKPYGLSYLFRKHASDILGMVLNSSYRALFVGGLIMGFLPPAEADSPAAPLARFTFNGHAHNSASGKAEWELLLTEFRDDALYLNGVYEFGPHAERGYHALCRTPDLQYTAFTVTLRFQAESFTDDPATMGLIVGGRNHRWFALERSRAGHLTVMFNNGAFRHELMNTKLKAGKWTVVSCGVDLAAGRVVVLLDGAQVGDFSLPENFRLEVIGSKFEATDKLWTFVNYSNTNLFHGLVDELVIHNQMLSSDEMRAESQKLPRTRSEADIACMQEDSAAAFLTPAEQELLNRVSRERFKYGLPALTANRQLAEAARGHAANMARQQIVNHTLDGITFDKRIDATGYRCSAAGENIWSAATAAEAIAGWMGSPGHQRNMMSQEFLEIGVGIGVSKSSQKYLTLVFGTPDARPRPQK